MSDLICKVLDHLISNVAPWLENNMSPLANCLVGSKEPTVRGKRLESLRRNKQLVAKICILRDLERFE